MNHRRMINNLCRQVLDDGMADTHTEDLLAAEVRRLQAENDRLRAEIEDRAGTEENLRHDLEGRPSSGMADEFVAEHYPGCAEVVDGRRQHYCIGCSRAVGDYVNWPCAAVWNAADGVRQ